jgi:hypothetical protein
MKTKTNEELEAIIEKQPDAFTLQEAITELNFRHLKALKVPHWTATWGFWVTLVAAVAACIAAYPIVESWFFTAQTQQLGPSDPQAQSGDTKPLPPSQRRDQRNDQK